jgi:nucleotide-binding universal stress UspA family protein
MSSTEPIVFAYDGSDQAKEAIAFAGDELPKDRPAVVLTVWGPLSAIPFGGVAVMSGADLDPAIEQEAQRTAEEGRSLLEAAGFETSVRVERAVPIWQRIVEVCDEVEAAMVVLGSHGHSGLQAVLLGSVATAVSQHTSLPVLIVH